jgi:hypothetical protein
MERDLGSTRRGFAQIAGAAGLVTSGGLWAPALAAGRQETKSKTTKLTPA